MEEREEIMIFCSIFTLSSRLWWSGCSQWFLCTFTFRHLAEAFIQITSDVQIKPIAMAERHGKQSTMTEGQFFG